MLEVKNLTKKFKKTTVDEPQDSKPKFITALGLKKSKKKTYEVGIENLTFSAQRGKVFGLIGANGAGKTTTMRILAGITKARGGEIIFEGENINNIKEYKSKAAFVSSETQPYERLTPNETMTLFARLAGIEEKDIEKRIKKITEELDMKSFLHTPLNNFSTGMRQKVSIAKALITEPEIMIFDEVTNGLDIFAHRAILEIIRKFKENGKIVIFSTHILSDADEVCDDLALIHKGKIVETGNKDEILKKYEAKDISEVFFKAIKEEK